MSDPLKKEVDDIVAMLDNFMQQGGGHMNIEAHSVSEEKELDIQNEQFFGCGVVGGRKMACQTPTLMEDLDFNEEN